MSIIKTMNLTKRFGNNVIFENLNFSVEKGEIVTIVGPSGQGKSTFLRCLIGLEKIDGGTIEIGGQKAVENGNYVKEQNDIFSKIGIVFQNFNLFNNLTVRENLEFACKNYADKIREKSNNLLEQFGLLGKENEYPQSLSGGQKQRVAIARTLMMDPEIILFDEPTSALDGKNRLKVAKLVKDLSKLGYTIIVVTHDTKLLKELEGRAFKIARD